MNRILLASFAVLGMVGTAAAAGSGGGAPGLYGSNYSANVLQTYNGGRHSQEYYGTVQPRLRSHAVSPTTSMHNSMRDALRYSTDGIAGVQQRPSYWEIHSGR